MRGNPHGSIIIISLVMCDMSCSSPESDPEGHLLANGEKAGIGPKQPMGLQGGARLITPPSFTRKGNGKTRCWGWKKRLHLHRNPATGQTYSTLDRFLCHLRVDVCNGLCLCQHVYLRSMDRPVDLRVYS